MNQADGPPGLPGELELRAAVESGPPSHALFDAWPAPTTLPGIGPGIVSELLDTASQRQSADARAAVVFPDAIAFALLDSRGRLLKTTRRFAEWVGDPGDSVDCRDLAKRALTSSRAMAAARTLNHGVLALLAVRGAAVAGWPLLLEGLGRRPDDADVVLVVFAPSRSRGLVLATAAALGLTPLESRLAAAMLIEPTLEAAAASLGVGRETAKDALGDALRKTGARRAQDLVGRIIDLSCEATEGPAASQAAALGALGLSPAERAVSRRLALGDTAEEAAMALGLKPGTVKTYRKSIFGKLGIARIRDLRRLMAETAELDRLAAVGEVVAGAAFGDEAAVRVFVDASGRNVACLDYGPARGRALVVMHGYTTGRTAPPPLLSALRARGYRVIIPQRPGFGVSSAAEGDYVDTATADLSLVLDRLGCAEVSILARDGGVASALAFGVRFPHRLRAGVLMNPRKPKGAAQAGRGPMAALSAMLLDHPQLIDPFCAMMSRQSSAEVLGGVLRRVLTSSASADRICIEEPEVARRLIDDTRRLGRQAAGFVAEFRLFAHGWHVPDDYQGPQWRLALSGEIATPSDLHVWRHVIADAPHILDGAGLLAQFTHAEALAALFD